VLPCWTPVAPAKPLASYERLVLDAVWLERLGAARLLHPLDVVAPRALEPDRLGVSFEGEDVGRDAVEEPAVVRDHDGAARELEQRLLERAQRVDVEVVRRLVEEEDVAARAQELREMDAVPLAAREIRDALLLVGALEVEPRDVLARIDLALAELDRVVAARDLLPDVVRRVEVGPRLVDVGELDGLADAEGPVVGLRLAGDHPKQRRLAGAVRADDADDAGGGQREGEVVDEEPVAEALAHAVGVDHDVAEPRAGRDVDLDAVELDVLLLGEEALVRAEARLRLRVTGARARPHPLELARERAAARRLLLLLLREPCLLLLEPRRIIALERDAAAAVELEDPACDVVEEVAVVGDGDDRAPVALEEALEPEDGFRVEVVRRLVEQEEVGRREQQPAERDPAELAARERLDVAVP